MLLLMSFFLSCKKESTNKISLDSVCQDIIAPNPALIGKWQLNYWYMIYHNNLFCEYIGANQYSAQTNDINVVMEITSKGVMNFYFDDTLASSYLLTGSNNYGFLNSIYYSYNCGTENFVINTSDSNFDNVSLGDTISISGPDFNFNYIDGVLKAITTGQYYVKIE